MKRLIYLAVAILLLPTVDIAGVFIGGVGSFNAVGSYPHHRVRLVITSWDGVSSFTGVVYMLESGDRVPSIYTVSGYLDSNGVLWFVDGRGHLISFSPVHVEISDDVLYAYGVFSVDGSSVLGEASLTLRI